LIDWTVFKCKIGKKTFPVTIDCTLIKKAQEARKVFFAHKIKLLFFTICAKNILMHLITILLLLPFCFFMYMGIITQTTGFTEDLVDILTILFREIKGVVWYM